MTVIDNVRDFIATNFYVDDTDSLADEASLLELGIVDSTGVLEVIEFIETTHGVHVLDAEMLPANLDSIARIAGFIERKHRLST